MKLDASLTRDVHRDAAKRKISSSLIELTLQLGIAVIAKGVENESDRDALAALGCDLVQGHLYAAAGASLLPEAAAG